MEHIPLLIKVDIWLKVVTKKRKEKIHVNERNELRLHHLSLINGDGDITIDDEGTCNYEDNDETKYLYLLVVSICIKY